MIVLTPAVARTWEEKSLQAGDRMKDLMRQAVDGALRELRPFLPQPSTALILIGSGHNGDDALLLGLELKELGWNVDFLLSHSPGRRTHPDPRVKAKHWKTAIPTPDRGRNFKLDHARKAPLRSLRRSRSSQRSSPRYWSSFRVRLPGRSNPRFGLSQIRLPERFRSPLGGATPSRPD